MLSPERVIQILNDVLPETLEEAGKEGIRIQEKGTDIKSSSKTATGNEAIDLVTEADLALQSIILSKLLRTELRRCIVMAEEDTKEVTQFTGEEDICITLDPVNGTKRFRDGSMAWEIVVGARDARQALFTCSHSPRLGYTIRIDEDNGIQEDGQLPFSGNEQKKVMARRFDELLEEHQVLKYFFAEQDLEIVKEDAPIPEINGRAGRNIAFVGGNLKGILIRNANVYDGILPVHFAKHSGGRVITFGREGSFVGETDLANPVLHKGALVYPGGYLALNA